MFTCSTLSPPRPQGGTHALVHCSDGWDRTAQVAALVARADEKSEQLQANMPRRPQSLGSELSSASGTSSLPSGTVVS